MAFPLAMGWRHLLFANWPVAPDVVESHLPAGLEPDTYDGDAWLSVVPFTNVAVRPARLPARLGAPLPELNLRTYVTPAGADEPGVYFFSLDAQGVLAVLGARVFHSLPYYYASIDIDAPDDGPIRFECRRRHPGDRALTYRASYGPTGPLEPTEAGSLPAFLLERYRLYAQAGDGTLRYTAVDHAPWHYAPATVDVAGSTVFEANGFSRPSGDPVCYYSPGVDVVASPSRRYDADTTDAESSRPDEEVLA
jgi:hypothetical protein